MKAEIAAIAVVGVLILFVIRPALKDGGSHGTSPPMSTSEIYSKLVGKTFACADPFLATFTADEALSTSKNSLRITIKGHGTSREGATHQEGSTVTIEDIDFWKGVERFCVRGNATSPDTAVGAIK